MVGLYFTFVVIIVCASFTVTSLMASSSWRKSLAGAVTDVSNRRHRKERKLIPMLPVISMYEKNKDPSDTI